MSEQIPSVLQALRQATQQSHKAVERLTPFFAPDFDQSAYLDWLELMHGFYSCIDAVVDQAGFAAATGWHYIPRRRLIELDIEALTQQKPTILPDKNNLLHALSELRNTAEVAGMLYVVEGSALGGEVLMKVFSRKLGLSAANGASFFAPHGNDPRSMWGNYVQLLGRLTTSANVETDVVRGAVTCFSTLQTWILQKD
jgi:heme oxygenase